MKKLELEKCCVKELDSQELANVDGGQASPQGVWNSVKNAGKHVVIAAGYVHLANLNAINAYANGAKAFVAGFLDL